MKRENTTNKMMTHHCLKDASQSDANAWKENVHLKNWWYTVSHLNAYNCLLVLHTHSLAVAQEAIHNQALTYISFSSAWQAPSQSPSRPHRCGDDASLCSQGILNFRLCNNTYALLYNYLPMCFSPPRTTRNLRIGCVSRSPQYPQPVAYSRSWLGELVFWMQLKTAWCA